MVCFPFPGIPIQQKGLKILMIGAHQDDNELRCGGLAHKICEYGL